MPLVKKDERRINKIKRIAWLAFHFFEMSYVPVKTDEEDEVDAQGEKVVSFSKQFHTTMISLLFGISKEGNSSVWMPYIVYFVEIAQLVAFNFRPYFKFVDKNCCVVCVDGMKALLDGLYRL